jgi:hypothetical protein
LVFTNPNTTAESHFTKERREKLGKSKVSKDPTPELDPIFEILKVKVCYCNLCRMKIYKM